MADVDPDIEEIEEFDSSFHPDPTRRRRGWFGVAKVFIGAAVVMGSVVISTNAINSYYDGARLNAALEIVTEAGNGITGSGFPANRDGAGHDRPLSRPAEVPQVGEAVAAASQAPVVGEVSDVVESLVQSDPLPMAPEPVAMPTVTDAEVAVPPQQDTVAQIAETAPVEIAAIAPKTAPETVPETTPVSAPASASIPEPAASPADREPAIADGVAWRVQLVALKNKDNAETARVRLQRANQDLLAGLEMRVQRAELPKGIFYRVQAGPLADRIAAASLCNSLNTRRQDCFIVAP